MSAGPRGTEPLYTSENYNPEDSIGRLIADVSGRLLAAFDGEMTGMGIDWGWRQARENKIPHHKLGGRYRWTAEDLAALAAQTAVAQTGEHV